MISSFKSSSIKWTIFALSLTLMVGCSKTTAPPKNNIDNTQNQNVEPVAAPTNPTTTVNPSTSSGDNASTPAPVQNESQKKVLSDILRLAKEGKIINCEFPAKSTVIEDIEKKWGMPDSTDYVAAAKGSYATFLKKNVVFGFNKGSQIFEVRSLSKDLNKISMEMVKQTFGTPAYDVKTKSEEIIGYVVNEYFKLLFVFPKSSLIKSDQFLDHYSVLYPRGTVNNMADDPGRQW